MSIILQLTIGGLAMGCIYALIAVGMNLLYNATGGMNWAQSSLVMLGAYVALTYVRLFQSFKWPMLASAVFTVPTAGVIGALFGYLLYEPIRYKGYYHWLLVALSAGMLVSEAVPLIWGTLPYMLPRFISTSSIRLGNLIFDTQSLVIIGVVFATIGIMQLFLNKTEWGLMMRAVGQSKEVASLMGIPVRQSIRMTFALSTALAAIAGVLAGPIFFVSVMLLDVGGKGFATAVLGGFSPRVSGVIIAGLLIGLVEVFASFFLSSAFHDAWGFLFLIVFLIFRPTGIFGEQRAEKA
jgi:branched-chain amino acid transport system permease protein